MRRLVLSSTPSRPASPPAPASPSRTSASWRFSTAGPELTAQYLANAQRALLEGGVTGLRMAGTPHFIDVALKRAFDSGQHVGPRLFTCGWFLTTTAGHALGTGFALPCDGPAGFVRTIREHIQAGVDHVKLNLTGGIMGPAWDRQRSNGDDGSP